VGTAQSATGNIKEGLIAFNKAISLIPNYSRAYSSRAGIRYLLGDKKGANTDVKEAIRKMDQKRPDISSLYSLVSVSFYDSESRQNIYNLADQAFTNSPEESQNNLLLYLVRGNIRLIQKKDKEALFDFDQIIGLNDNFPIAYYLRAFSRLNTLDDLPASLEDLNQAIALSPNFAQAYLARGYIYQKLKEPTKSQADFLQVIDIYTKVIRRNPNNLHAYTRRRKIYSYLGNTENAELDLLQLVKLRGRQGIKSPLSSCENQRMLASFRDLVSSCQ
jgi:tetratricopeptide (TPR) repeat protein